VLKEYEYMGFDLGGNLPELMRERALNTERGRQLDKLKELLGARQQREMLSRVYKESAAEVFDLIIEELAAIDSGQLAPNQRRFSDPQNRELRNREFIERAAESAGRQGRRLTPDEINDAISNPYLP
jgi:hypothetical protein